MGHSEVEGMLAEVLVSGLIFITSSTLGLAEALSVPLLLHQTMSHIYMECLIPNQVLGLCPSMKLLLAGYVLSGTLTDNLGVCPTVPTGVMLIHSEPGPLENTHSTQCSRLYL